MGAKENLELVEELRQAAQDRDFDRYGSLLAEDVVFRMAGVPGALGGVTRGRKAVLDQVREMTSGGHSRSRRCSVTTATFASWAR